MQSEIPLNFILQKTNQLKNTRQKKRLDVEHSKTQKSARQLNQSKSKTRDQIPDDAIYKIITGGKKNPHSEKKKNL